MADRVEPMTGRAVLDFLGAHIAMSESNWSPVMKRIVALSDALRDEREQHEKTRKELDRVRREETCPQECEVTDLVKRYEVKAVFSKLAERDAEIARLKAERDLLAATIEDEWGFPVHVRNGIVTRA